MSKNPLTKEIATIGGGRDITRGYIQPLNILDPQDSILASKGGDYQIYEELLRDDQVASCFQQRRLAVVCREWEVIPGGNRKLDKEAAKYIENWLKAIDFDNITNKMLFGVFFGFGVSELLWKNSGKYWEIPKIKVKKQRRFAFDPDGNLKLLTFKAPYGEALPPKNFWHFSCGADNDDEPYGLGLAHFLYWPCFFKRNGLKFWLNFLDRFASPPLHGQTNNSNPTQKEIDDVTDGIKSLRNNGGIVTPLGTQIDVLTAQGGAVDHAKFLDRMNAAISKIVLSQTMTTDNGSSRSQSEVHERVVKAVIKSDADLICQSFNQGPIRWLIEFNFPGAALPQVWRKLDDEESLNERIERDDKIVSWGFRPNPDYLEEVYGWERDENESEDSTTVLNGAQVQSVVEVLSLVASKQLPAEAGIEVIKAAFPFISDSRLNKMMRSAANFTTGKEEEKTQPVTEEISEVEEEETTPDFAELNLNSSQKINEKLLEDTQFIVDNWIGQIRKTLNESDGDLSSFQEQLYTLYPNLESDDLTVHMAQAMALNRLAGQEDAAINE
jgi:phage gp29-like protein